MEYALGVDDAMLHVGPLTHAAGVHLLPCYLRGARNIVADGFDAEQVLARIASERITQLMVVPTMLSRLLEALAAEPCGRHLRIEARALRHGADADEHGARGAAAASGPILRQQYGMTEAVQPLCVLYPHEHLQDDGQPSTRITSCGRPTMNVDDHRARRRRQGAADTAKSARSPSPTAASARWRSGAGPTWSASPSATAGTTAATSAASTTKASVHRRPQQGHDDQRRLQRLCARGRGCACSRIRPWPRWPCWACPTPNGARSSPRSSCASPGRAATPKACANIVAS